MEVFRRMESQFSRTALLIGADALDRLWGRRIALFGAGGVGGFAAEALIRAGVGALDVFDNDTISESNLNRQIIALHSTLGMSKVDAIKARLNDISPNAQIGARQLFYLPETADQVDFAQYDYIIDCVDTVKAKVDLAVRAFQMGIPIISAMGAGNKLDPTAFEVADLYETSVCPLARVMRSELRKRGVTHLKVVYSKEPPLVPREKAKSDAPGRRSVPGSISFCPSVAGLILAGEVIRDLLGITRE